MKQLVLEVSDLLQNIPDSRAQCIERLIGTLEKRGGIKNIQLQWNEKSTPQLCIHFDENVTSEERIKHIARQTGKKLDETFGRLKLRMRRTNDPKHLEAATTILKNFRGVINVLAAPTGWIFLEFNKYIIQESILRELIEKTDLLI